MGPRTLSTPEDFKELVDAHDVWLFECVVPLLAPHLVSLISRNLSSVATA